MVVKRTKELGGDIQTYNLNKELRINFKAVDRNKPHHESRFDKWIKKFNDIHNYKFEYLGFRYDLNKFGHKIYSVHVKCPIHGAKWQSVNGHLYSKGCISCGAENAAKKFWKDIRAVHSDTYIYSESIFILLWFLSNTSTIKWPTIHISAPKD